jgi:hypothetical protein
MFNMLLEEAKEERRLGDMLAGPTGIRNRGLAQSYAEQSKARIIPLDHRADANNEYAIIYIPRNDTPASPTHHQSRPMRGGERAV